MGNRRINEDNPPAYTSPLEENNDFAMTIRPNGASDHNVMFRDGSSTGRNLVPFPNMPLPVVPPWENLHSTYQPCAQGIPETGGNSMADFMMLNSLSNPNLDVNPGAFRTSLSEVPLHERNMRMVPHYINQDNEVIGDDLMNDGAGFSSFQNPQTNRNFMLVKNSAGSYQMTRQGVEAKTNNVNRPQINGNFVTSPTSFHTQDNGHKQIGNNANFSTDRYGFQQKVDGNFLSLGIGGNAEALSKPTFRSREISDRLKEAVAVELNTSHVQQPIRSSLSPGQNVADGFPCFQVNARGFSNPVCNVDGWTSSNNDVGIIRGANSQPVCSPFHMLQTPQDLMQYNIPMIGGRNSSIVSNRNVKYADLDSYRAFPSNQAALPGALGHNSARFLSSQQMALSGLAQDSAKHAWMTTQTPSDQLQNVYVKTAENLPSGSSMDSPYLGNRGSSTGRNHAGQRLLSRNGTAAQASGGSLFPQRIGVQVADNSGGQAATGDLFTNKLGVEITGRSGSQSTAERHPVPKGINMQTSKLCRPPDTESTQLPINLVRPPIAIGWPEDGASNQYPLNPHGPSSTAGQSQNALVPFSTDPWGTAYSNVASVCGLSQRSDFYGRPSFKRTAIQPPPTARLIQRQKITRPTMPPIPHPPPITPIPSPSPAAAYIKRKGSEGTPQPTGHKCLLCKRDLSFTSEGPVYQPTTSPAVAVLPCGHTFHDQCLQNITPEDQSKNPPCIPCAIGEN